MKVKNSVDIIYIIKRKETVEAAEGGYLSDY
jgi:hypothetical protein